MAEILLRTRELINAKEKHTVVKPRGSIIDVFYDRRIKNEWLRILCVYPSPQLRDKYTTLPYFTEIISAWSPTLYQNYLDWDKSKVKDTDKFWTDNIASLGILPVLGTAPDSAKPLYETWLFSDTERKQFFTVYNDDATEEQLKTIYGMQEIIYKDKLYMKQKQYDYMADPAISKTTQGLINDPTQILYTQYDKPVPISKITDAVLTGLPEILTNYRAANSFDPEAFKLFRQREESSPAMHPSAGGYYSVVVDNGVFFGAKYEILDSGLFA